MKTAKVTKVVSVNEWTGGNGTIFYCHCEMDNGDKIDIGKKKVVEVGQELDYEVVSTQHEYHKAKSVMKDQAPTQGTSSSQKKFGGNNNPSFALSYAKDYHTANGVDNTQNPSATILATADAFLNWLNDKS